MWNMVPSARNVAAFCSCVAFAAASPVAAQDYYFEVPREVVTVAVNADSSLDIDYKITFRNTASGLPIDIVDVGFPSDDYDLASVTADVDGETLDTIRPSEYLDVGVEVPLVLHMILPGEAATLHVRGLNYHMVFEDSADDAYASCVFSPTWFGSEFTTGSTHLTMAFVFPPGVTAEQARWHEDEGGEPTRRSVEGGRVQYVWEREEASPSEQYYFGISFPRSAVAEVRSPRRFRAVGVLLRRLGLFLGENYNRVWFRWGIPFVFLGILNLLIKAYRRRRRMRYFPPRAKVEGVGIKRGLTAPEAAVILEKPLDSVLTMILFALVKKDALAVTAREPFLEVEKLPFNENGLRPYEKEFLACAEPHGFLGEDCLREVLISLIKSVQRKMKGFSHRETVAYYRKIVKTAWRLVEEADTPEVKLEEFTNGLEWTMLDDDFGRRTRDVFVGYDVPRPYWWGRLAPAAGPKGDVSFDVPTLPGANFANGVVKRLEGIADNVVHKLESFTGKVTATTNPPPVTTSSGGGYSGGGCACACACAGCACACAGGGR